MRQATTSVERTVGTVAPRSFACVDLTLDLSHLGLLALLGPTSNVLLLLRVRNAELPVVRRRTLFRMPGSMTTDFLTLSTAGR